MRVQDKVNAKSVKIQSHETSIEMVKDLLDILHIKKDDVVMDAGSGKNKVWFNCINSTIKYEYEIKDGNDYLEFKDKVDWTVGNPPYHISWDFHKKAIITSKKGIAWLVNLNNLNSLFTPKRLDFAKDNGFELTKMHILSDKRWFGRYFFIVFEKKKGILTWTKKSYGNNWAEKEAKKK